MFFLIWLFLWLIFAGGELSSGWVVSLVGVSLLELWTMHLGTGDGGS